MVRRNAQGIDNNFGTKHLLGRLDEFAFRLNVWSVNNHGSLKVS